MTTLSKRHRAQIDAYFELRGFWSYLWQSVSLNKALLLYFLVYGTLSLLALPLLFFSLRAAIHYDNQYVLAACCGGIVFLGMLNTRFFQVATAYTIIEHERGKRPTLRSTLSFTLKNLGLIFKLTLVNLLFTSALSVIAEMVGSLSSRASQWVVRLTLDFLFGIPEVGLQVLLAFMIPVSVAKNQTRLRPLFRETAAVIRGKALGSLAINLKLYLIALLLAVPALVSLAVLPEYVSQNTFRAIMGSECYLIVLIAQAAGLCTTAVYARVTYFVLNAAPSGRGR